MNRVVRAALGDVVRFVGGGTPDRSNPDFWGGSIPWATVKDFNSGAELRKPAESITELGLKSSASNLIDAGTVIIPTRMALGKAAITMLPVAINQDLKAVFPTTKNLDARYLLRYFLANSALIEKMGKGATVKGVTLEQIRAMQIPLPPLPEQRRIAAILDKADTLRAQRRQAIAKLDELVQSVFLEMVGDPVTNPKGWPMTRIGELMASVKYGSSDKATLAGEVPIVRMNNLTYAGEMDLSDLKFITREQAAEKYLLQAGDLLFNRTNSKELVGKTAVYDGPTPMAYAGYLVRARTLPGIAPEYVSAFLNSAYGKKTLQAMCKNIVGMANINAKEFASIAIPAPPESLQSIFRERVAQIKTNKRAMQSVASVQDAFFASLQHRAFSATL